MEGDPLRETLSISMRLYSTYITSSIGKGIPSASNWDFTQLTSPVLLGKETLLNHHQFYWERDLNWDFTQLTSPVLLGKGSPQHLIETLLNLHHQFYWERDPLSIYWDFTQLTSPVLLERDPLRSLDFTQLTSPVLLGKGSPQHLIETLLNVHHQFYWKGIPSASNWDFTQLTSPVLLGKGSPQHLIETLLNVHHHFYWERDPLSI